MTPSTDQQSAMARRKTVTGLALAGLVVTMVGLSYASVPLYRLFCQLTGFGGTPQVAVEAPREVLERMITVRFNAEIASGLAWTFEPVVRDMTLQIGENALAFYRAVNLTDRPLVGMASFNVTPDKAGQYFNKIACFCFDQQRLEPGQSIDMPVSFFVDPSLAKDRNMNDVSHITLSYTFFPVDDGVKQSRTTAVRDLAVESVN